MDDHTERTQAVGALVAAYPGTEVTELTIRTYVWSTSDLPLELLTVAMQQCRDKAKFFPSIAEIREQAEAIKGTQAKDETAANCIQCYGSNLYIPEGRDADGYRLPARRCEPHVFAEAVTNPDDADFSMF